MFAGERINVTEDRSVLHVALRMPRGRSLRRRRCRRRRRGARRARPDGRVRRCRPLRRLDGPHRACRFATSSTSASAAPTSGPVMAYEALAPLQRARPDLPLRLQRRRHGLRRGDARSRSGRDVVRRLLEDVHDARDDDERHDGAAVAPRRARRRRDRGRAALRRRVDEPRRGRGVRDRSRQRVRVLGLGRRSLLDGLRDRPLDDARDRAGGLRASCSPASTRWTSTSGRPRSPRTSRC